MKKFGFGLMRLPKNDGVIDVEQVKKMADEFIARGFTYFDTAYTYEGSEVAFREAVAKRYPRDAYTIADKLPGQLLKSADEAEKFFNESLERCGVDYFDYYLLHSIHPSTVAFFDKFDCWSFGLKMKEQGKIKKFGFSFHGAPDLLEELLTKHPEVDFVQLQINYLDWESDIVCSKENYEVCCRHNKPVTVMEPAKGGLLANPNPNVAEVFSKLDPKASAASFALRFAASLDNVKMVLSGMGSIEQMNDNLNTFEDFKPLTEEEHKAVEEARNIMMSAPIIECTACRYCTKGCPKHINIPDIFKCYNLYLKLGVHNAYKIHYTAVLLDSGRASECIGCGQCERACPQHLPIIENLKKASELLDA